MHGAKGDLLLGKRNGFGVLLGLNDLIKWTYDFNSRKTYQPVCAGRCPYAV